MTERRTAMQVLKLWNTRLLETIQHSSAPATSSKLLAVDEPKPKKSSGSKKSKSFRSSKKHSVKESDNIRRTGSFSENLQLSTGLSQGSAVNHQVVAPMIRTAGPARDTHRNWSQADAAAAAGGGILSQDSFFAPLTHGGAGVPPPLPPRPAESSSDEDDPDYAYIDERKVKGPGNRPRSQSDEGEPTVDDQLAALKRDIVRENKARKRAAAAEVNKQIHHAHHLPRPPVLSPAQRSPRSPRSSALDFAASEASDYLEPVPSKRLQSQSSDYEAPANHMRSFSEPDPFPLHSPNKLSQPSYQTNDSGLLSSRHRRNSRSRSPHAFNSDDITSPVNAPSLPPRTSRYGSTTSNASINSNASGSSSTGASSMGVPPRSSSMPRMNSEEGGDYSKPGAAPAITSRLSEGSTSPRALADGGLQSMTIPEEPLDVTPPPPPPPARKISPMQEQDPFPSDSPPPPLPPRSPTKERLSRKSSSSSISSTSSSRCPRCRSFRIAKSSVSKTVSLDHRAADESEGNSVRNSLPDLNDTSPIPENSLISRRSSHHCSHTSCGKSSPDSSSDGLASTSTPSLPSTHTFEYLQLIGDDKTAQQRQKENDNPISSPLKMEASSLGPELDLLTSCLETLQNKLKSVPQTPSSANSSNSPLQHSPGAMMNTQQQAGQHRVASSREEERRAIQSDLDAAMRQAQQVQADLTASSRRLQTASSVRSVSTTSYRNAHHPGVMRSHTMSTIPSLPSSQQQQPRQQHHVINHSHSNGALPQVPPQPLRTSTHRSVPPSTPSGSVPPIPPRSRVSLGQESPPPFSLNRSVSGGNVPEQHVQQQPPRRSASSLSQPQTPPLNSSFGAEQRPGMAAVGQRFAHHGNEGQSSTVFVHHLADRRLAHMV